VEQHLNAGITKKVVAGFSPDQGIMGQRIGVAIALRLGDPAFLLHHVDETVGKTEHNLLWRFCGAFGRCIEATHRSRQSSDSGAAAEAVFFQQQNAGAALGGGESRRHPGGAAADHQNVCVES